MRVYHRDQQEARSEDAVVSPLEPQPFVTEEGREIKRLRAELAEMQKQRDEAAAWRPIGTAPMNGMVVMLYGDGRVTCGSWISERDIMVSDHSGCYPSGETTPAYWQSHDGGFTEKHPPTHWMPLPQPPREKEGGAA